MKNLKEDNTPLIPGNVDKTVMIPRRELHCYHVLAEKRIIDPRNPSYPIIRTKLICFRPCDYKVYFQTGTENNIGYLKAMNFSNAKLIWDPCLPGARELDAKVKAEELSKRDPAAVFEHKDRQQKQKATIGDIERLLK